MKRSAAGLLAVLTCVIAREPAAGQAVGITGGAHAVPLVTHVSPILGGESRTEAYLTQPTLFGGATAAGGALKLTAAVSLEALTIERGELGAGAYGEGYVDRRHPHTYLHELTLAGKYAVGDVRASLAAGRGFAPFGTDDPMMRPFVKFPVNHHLGQVLERWHLTGGVRWQRAMLEAGIFNGNEPHDAKDLGSFDRFGDSWSARFTVEPVDGLEMQLSHAWVVSPELPVGGGWDQRKWSASARFTHPKAYLLAEWKHTTEVDRDVDVFSLRSVLAEAELRAGAWRPALRFEWSERPEEQRASNPFRTPWPHGGGHVLGITRWAIVSARIERTVVSGTAGIAPFIEGSMSHVSETADGLFDPAEFYGGTRLWTLNVGARVRIGWHPARMGRYGVAAPEAPAAPAHAH